MKKALREVVGHQWKVPHVLFSTLDFTTGDARSILRRLGFKVYAAKAPLRACRKASMKRLWSRAISANQNP